MKHVRKIFAFALTLFMAIAFALPAKATEATGKTIKVNPNNNGQTYTLYKLFDATTDGEHVAYSLRSGTSLDAEYTVTKSNGQQVSVKGSDWFKVLEDHPQNITNLETTNTQTLKSEEFRLWAKQFGAQIGQPIPAEQDNDSKVQWTNLADGYYFITTTTGTLISVDSTTGDTLEVKDKNNLPTLDDKTVTGGSATAATTQNSASVGDVLHYSVPINAKPGAKNYVFTDTMTKGLTLLNNTITVKAGSATLTAKTDNSAPYHYVIDSEVKTDGSTTFTITFNQAYLDTIAENITITIEYDAKVNADAVKVESGSSTNTAQLTFGESNNLHTEEKKTTTKYFKFGLYKTDNKNVILNGAKFKLYTAATDGELIQLVKDGDVYRPKLDDDTLPVVEIEAGQATIAGLQGGKSYWLEETVAPDGYNKLNAREEAAIGTTNNIGTVATTNGKTTYTANSGGVQVVNNAGTPMPSTGGIGTTIFYVVGGVLVAGAVVFLLTKRRVADSE